MKSVTIAEFKRNLPALLGEVAGGASIVVQKGVGGGVNIG